MSIKLSDLTCKTCIYGEKSIGLIECRKNAPMLLPSETMTTPKEDGLIDNQMSYDTVRIEVIPEYWCGEGEWMTEIGRSIDRCAWFYLHNGILKTTTLIDPHEA